MNKVIASFPTSGNIISVEQNMQDIIDIMTRTVLMTSEYFKMDPIIEFDVCEMSEDQGFTPLAYFSHMYDDLYLIELNKRWLATATRGEIVCVVSHEMVHVMQHLRGDKEVGHVTGLDYIFAADEREARGYEMAFEEMELTYV